MIIASTFIFMVMVENSKGLFSQKRSLIHGPRHKETSTTPSSVVDETSTSPSPVNKCQVEPILPPVVTKSQPNKKFSRRGTSDWPQTQNGPVMMPKGDDISEPDDYEETLKELKLKAANKTKPSNSKEIRDTNWDTNIGTRGAINNVLQRWWLYRLPIQIDPAFDKYVLMTINFVLWHLNLAMDKCFRFQIIPSDCTIDESAIPNYVYIKFGDPAGDEELCESGIGMVEGRQTVSLTEYCDEWDIMHQVMHALSFYDEHLRPDRNEYVKIDFDLMKKRQESQLFISKYDIPKNQTLWVEEYDFDSLLHNRFDDYMQPKEGVVPEGVRVGQRNHLSKLDIKRLKAAYDCTSPWAYKP